MSANHLETIKQVAQHLDTIIGKIDNLVYWPWDRDESYELLRELETAVEQIDNLNEQLETIFDDDTFCDDVQNKPFVENLDEVYKCFDAFSFHFSKIESVLHEEGPRENYEKDYEYFSAQLKKSKQHLDLILL